MKIPQKNHFKGSVSRPFLLHSQIFNVSVQNKLKVNLTTTKYLITLQLTIYFFPLYMIEIDLNRYI